jgi:hypothetical protein
MAGLEEEPSVVTGQAPDQAGDKGAASAAVERKGSNEAVDVVTAENLEFDASALPKGTIDPVYEAKARVLNHAVRS